MFWKLGDPNQRVFDGFSLSRIYLSSLKRGLHLFLLGAKGIAARSKDATRGSWHYY